jgi:hypothetical protein
MGCKIEDIAEAAMWDNLQRESWKLRAVEEISPERERESKQLSAINRTLKRFLR